MTEQWMLMLLIELKGGSSELCDGDVEMSWNVGVGSGSDAWIRLVETMGRTHQNVFTRRVCV